MTSLIKTRLLEAHSNQGLIGFQEKDNAQDCWGRTDNPEQNGHTLRRTETGKVIGSIGKLSRATVETIITGILIGGGEKETFSIAARIPLRMEDVALIASGRTACGGRDERDFDFRGGSNREPASRNEKSGGEVRFLSCCRAHA